MEQAPGLSSWWKKAAISLGAATVLALAVHRSRQKTKTSTQSKTLVVIAAADRDGANAAAKAFGSATIVDVKNIREASADYEVVAVFCSDAKYFKLDMPLLQTCLEKLVPGGALTAQLGGLSAAETAGLETTGLFAGAVDSKVSKGAMLPIVSFSCRKPEWVAGATSSLSSKIDEDALLGEVPTPAGQGKSDCSSKPKACANCSCGRSDLEAEYGLEEAKKMLENGAVRSACGSCNLGDAFRCAGCPYRGQPAFKPGTKVELGSGETEGTGQLAMNVGSDDVVHADSGKLLIAA